MDDHHDNVTSSEAEPVQVPENAVDQDYLILEQQKSIEKAVADQYPLVGPLVGFESVKAEYPPDSPFVTKLNELEKRYRGMRSIRRDGNCFLRSFAFGYFERCLHDPAEFQKFKKFALRSKTDLVEQGLPDFAVEDAYENVVDVFKRMENGLTTEELSLIFNDAAVSDYMVSYLRMVISGHLQKECAFYEPFLIDQSIKEFCQREVEPMYRECDHVHVTALANATNVPIRVEYLDREQDAVNTHDFMPMDIHGEGSPGGNGNTVAAPAVSLLFRPGHYDLLYVVT
jgi:ubiquitin thioesterase protein OTUB1